MSDSFFIHPQHRKSIVTIYPATALPVHVEDAAQNARKQAFTISVDQLTPANLLVIIPIPRPISVHYNRSTNRIVSPASKSASATCTTPAACWLAPSMRPSSTNSSTTSP